MILFIKVMGNRVCRAEDWANKKRFNVEYREIGSSEYIPSLSLDK